MFLNNITLCLADVILSYTLREAMNQTQKFIGLLAILPLALVALTPGFNNLAFAEANSFIEIQYSINVGADRYLIHYNVCAGEKSLLSQSIILESEQDTVQVDTTKTIGAYSCLGFESIIDTKSPQLVKITIVE